eukprot:5764954-Pyramimonas_sp.AAC.1
MTVAVIRGIFISVEQPRASMLMLTPQFKFAAEVASLVPIVSFLGAFGSPSPKPVQIWNNWRDAAGIRRTKQASDRRLGASKVKLAVHQA